MSYYRLSLAAATLALGRLRLRNALFVLFIGLAPTSVPALDHTATSTPGRQTVGLFLNESEAFAGYTLFGNYRRD